MIVAGRNYVVIGNTSKHCFNIGDEVLVTNVTSLDVFAIKVNIEKQTSKRCYISPNDLKQ